MATTRNDPEAYWFTWVLLLMISSALVIAKWHYWYGPGPHLYTPVPPDIAAVGIILYCGLVAMILALLLKNGQDFSLIFAILLVLILAIVVFVETNNAYQWIITSREVDGWLWWWTLLLATVCLYGLACALLTVIWFSKFRLLGAAATLLFLTPTAFDVFGTPQFIQNIVAHERFFDYLLWGSGVALIGILALLVGEDLYNWIKQRTKQKLSPVNASSVTEPKAEAWLFYSVIYGHELDEATTAVSRIRRIAAKLNRYRSGLAKAPTAVPIGSTTWPSAIRISGLANSGATPLLADLFCQHWRSTGSGQRVMVTTDWNTLAELVHHLEEKHLTETQILIPQGKRPYGYSPVGAVNGSPDLWAERLRHWFGIPIGEQPEEKRLAHLLYFGALLAHEVLGEEVSLTDVAEALFNEQLRQEWLEQSQTESPPWEAPPQTRLALHQFWKRTFNDWPAETRASLLAQVQAFLAPYRLPDAAVLDWPAATAPPSWETLTAEKKSIVIYLSPACGQAALDWSRGLLDTIAEQEKLILLAWVDPSGRFTQEEAVVWLSPFHEHRSLLLQHTAQDNGITRWFGKWVNIQCYSTPHPFSPDLHTARIVLWNQPGSSASDDKEVYRISTALARRPQQLDPSEALTRLRQTLAYATPEEREARRQALLRPESNLTLFDRRQLLLAGWGQL